MAKIKSTRSGSHQANLVENQKHEVYLMMQRLKRDKYMLSAQNKTQKENR
ncbi:hypothetical protein PGH26_13630 [Sporosarcina jeotgali]|uniref:30S ribosomal protein S15 n=1 Tax=Sporosarcina jeotgali TaxID=3020056 RepID=A0ABZ0KTY6_9BACL|nr:hypothetical protein [Sporosarcina sp. B2O-1]WOV83905.1 hypothetical protein PGH26_13630 [Sporosarcina sp. B2O-1]